MGIILNKEELINGVSQETSKLREDALDILEAGLEAIDTGKILKKKLKIENGILSVKENLGEDYTNKAPSPSGRGLGGGAFDLNSFERIIFVGIGKCALDGAKNIKEILGSFLTEGAVIDVKDVEEAKDLVSDGKVKYFQGTHPLPSQQNISATKEIIKMVTNLSEKDLVITLISGGGSSLFELPVDGVSLEDIINKTQELTARGADIYELNAARKEMSQVKGGKFAEVCHPAVMLNLIFSDVLGNDISVIASGPTVVKKNKNYFSFFKRILAREKNSVPSPVSNILLCSNLDALNAMKEKAKSIGYDSEIETNQLSGNAIEVGKSLVLKDTQPNKCLLFGGETTVLLPPASVSASTGKGGRNQTEALSALRFIKENCVSIFAASDGWDNTDHAGVLIDKEIFENSKELNLNIEDFLQRSDSYNFWKVCGGAIFTGRLGSNVSDLAIIISK